jgi:putative ABC transport system permease protein
VEAGCDGDGCVNLEAARSELAHGLRRLARSPGFVLSVVVSLGLGIGADVTMLGLLDSLLLRAPPHVHDVGRLAEIRVRTYPDYVDLRDQVRSFSGVAAWYAPPRPYAIAGSDRIVPVQQMLASASLFAVLGVRPALGRFFGPDEDRPGGPHVAVLGYGLWQRQFGGSRDVLGRTLRLAGDLYTVIGVAPQGFTGVALRPVDIFLPITTTKSDAGPAALTSRDYFWVRVVARLGPGVPMAQAQAEAKLIYRRANPDTETPRWQLSMLGGQPADVHPVMEMRRELGSGSLPVMFWLAAVATAVLLVACANVAGLMLARAARGRRELAVRAALGASRKRLLGTLLVEGGALSLAGSVLGLIASRPADGLIRGLLLTDLAPLPSPLDWRLVALAAGLTAVAALACWAGAGLGAVRGNLALELANGARSLSAPHARARRLLLVVQVAMAMVLVVGAALFTASLRDALGLDLGMSLDSVLVSDLDLAGAGYTPARARAMIDPITRRLMAIPGVRSVGLSDAGMQPGFLTYAYAVPGGDASGAERVRHSPQSFTAVTPDFLRTLGTPIIRGRDFTDGDRAARVIIVSDAFARLYWPGADPIGRCVKVGARSAPCLDVVGVTHDRRRAPGDTTALIEAFVPLGSPGEPEELAKLFPLTSVAVRFRGSASTIALQVQRALEELLPDAPSIRVRPAGSMFERQLRAWRTGAILFTAFGAIAVALAMFGIYSLVAYLVAQRRRELAIRVALGASASHLSRAVYGETLRMALVGVGLGLPASLLLARGVRALLFGVSPLQPAVYAGAALVLLISGLAAAVVPVQRAVAVDPTLALREE